MIVCKLSEWGEANVTTLADAVGLSPSALSQHLSKLRKHGIVTFRRDSQTIWYRIADPRTEKLFATLHQAVLPTGAQGSACSGSKQNQEAEGLTDFTPISATIGGLLIGVSAALLLILNGRIAGISGIVGGLLQPQQKDFRWRVAFVAGLFVAPFAYMAAGGPRPDIEITSTPALLLVGGILVGFGARLGAGCTSGHGVCGIGRGSPRSLTATAIFMTVAIVTVFVTRHIAGI